MNFKFVRPGASIMGFSVESNQSFCNSWASICILFCISSPLAVGRRIAFVIIATFQGFPSWSWTHISKEIFKLQPALTDCDTTAAVIFLTMWIVWIASFFHSNPNIINSRSCLSMGFIPSSALYFDFTTTALRSATSEIKRVNRTFCAAFTATKPFCMIWIAQCASFKYYPPTKFLTSKINELRHDLSMPKTHRKGN